MRVAALHRAIATPKMAATRLALFTVVASAGAREIAGYSTTYEVVTEGKGAAVVSKGDSVTVHAKGTVAESQKKFWSTKDLPNLEKNKISSNLFKNSGVSFNLIVSIIFCLIFFSFSLS